MKNSEKPRVFTIPATYCRRCGGLLTSEKGIREGYGPCCLKKMQEEEIARLESRDQISLFDINEPKGD